MKIVIVGASGFVGRELVSALANKVDELLLVGRDPEKLSILFPAHNCIGYDDLEERGKNFDRLLCLLTLNNNVAGTIDDFRRVNVGKVHDLAVLAERIGVKMFVNFSTFQIVSATGCSNHYAKSKLEAEEALIGFNKINIVNLRLPMVYGSSFSGKLSMLRWLPKWLLKIVLGWLGAVKPIVHVSLLAKEVLEMPEISKAKKIYLSDHLGGNFWYLMGKRLIDISGALMIVIFLGWLFPVIWLIVKFGSSGPAFFSQRRVGRDKKEFNCYKFRTMYVDTIQSGTHEIPASSVTPVGKFLRATKIDELPQVANVLKNEMSLIGPRPCLPQQLEVIEKRDLLSVFDIKPGITGLAQIKGIDMSRPAALAQADNDYRHVQGFWLDMKILLATITGSGAGDRVAKVEKLKVDKK